jgi:hypothetical protein
LLQQSDSAKGDFSGGFGIPQRRDDRSRVSPLDLTDRSHSGSMLVLSGRGVHCQTLIEDGGGCATILFQLQLQSVPSSRIGSAICRGGLCDRSSDPSRFGPAVGGERGIVASVLLKLSQQCFDILSHVHDTTVRLIGSGFRCIDAML